MDRHPALLDPRSPLPSLPPSAPRSFRWSLVWVPVLLLTVSAGIAWFAVSPPFRLSALNLGSADPAKAGGSANANASKLESRAVAIAYVDVEKGTTGLYTVRPGRVVAVYANEGDRVKLGDKLFKIDDAFAQEQMAEAKLALAGAEKKKEEAHQLVKQHEAGLVAQEAKIAVREADVAVAQANVDKARRFFDERLGGTEEDIRIAQKMVEKAKAGVRAEQAELNRFRAVKPSLAVEAADLEIQAKKHLVKKAEMDLERYIERAPSNGMILRSFVNLGETLGTNPLRPAMQFAPEGERVVRAEVEQEFADSIKVGMSAQIQDYESSKSPVLTGKVTRVSEWIDKRKSTLLEPLQFNDVRTMEVIIRLEGEEKNKYRIGQRVRVMLEKANGS